MLCELCIGFNIQDHGTESQPVENAINRFIVDFNAEDDQLLVGKNALKGLGKKPEFGTASNRKELNALAKEDMDLVYFEPKGFLYYNQNDEGKGFGKKGGLFAILQGMPEMTEDNIGLMG